MKYQAKGTPMNNETATRAINSFDNKPHKLNSDAPNTFLTPISFVRCSAINDAIPNNPRQLMKMASIAKKPASLPMRSSLPNFFAYSSSVNWYSNGCAGLNFLKTVSIFANADLALTEGLI